ncbi:AsmA family protein [Polaromonas sp. UC242_47]|uniref:AsmA family protein n=1 Tax=Polaromonas sp. UC242_47 TaxID=3374626 RepID=UPI0037A18936
MARFFKWLLLLSLAVLLLLGAVALALQHWVGSDNFRQDMAREASAALGLPVQLGGIELALWPLPAVAVRDIRVASQPALTLARVEVRPGWTALLSGRLEIATLVLRQAVLPQQAVDAILLSLQKRSYPRPLHLGQRPKRLAKIRQAARPR